MMQDDPPLPRPSRRLVDQPVLDSLGLDELREYVADLTAEIARAEAAIARKDGHRAAMDALFARPPTS